MCFTGAFLRWFWDARTVDRLVHSDKGTIILEIDGEVYISTNFFHRPKISSVLQTLVMLISEEPKCLDLFGSLYAKLILKLHTYRITVRCNTTTDMLEEFTISII